MRRIGRRFEQAYLKRVHGYHATEPYAKAMRKRNVRAEPLVAEAKDWHGLRRFWLRGLPKVNGGALLIGAGHNLKRLLSRSGWGHRPWPNGAAGVVLPAAIPVAEYLCNVVAPPAPPRPLFSTGCSVLETLGALDQ